MTNVTAARRNLFGRSRTRSMTAQLEMTVHQHPNRAIHAMTSHLRTSKRISTGQILTLIGAVLDWQT
jgi:hypothetical protein